MLVYILKIILIQAIGLGIYYTVLRNEKLFAYARTFLWTVIISSYAIPFVQLPIFKQTAIADQIDNLPHVIQLNAIAISASPSQSINWAKFLLLGVVLISLVQLVRLFFSYKRIIRLKNTANFTEPNIYASPAIQLPFSFLKSIYIPQEFLSKNELTFILAHEQAHIDKKHSIDKIIITFLARVFWFNPLFILFHKELELIHEYQVDDCVTQHLQLEDYLNSLLQSSIYIQSSPIELTHSFFSSPIKNRIIMLHKKSKNQMFIKKLLTLTLLSVFLVSFTILQSVAQENKKVIKKVKYTTVDASELDDWQIDIERKLNTTEQITRIDNSADVIYTKEISTTDSEDQDVEKRDIGNEIAVQAKFPGGMKPSWLIYQET